MQTIDHATRSSLAETGVVRNAHVIDVDTSHDSLAGGTVSKLPVDRASTLEKNAAAAYTRWLKAEVQEAIDDTGPSVPHEDAMRRVRSALKLP